LDEGLTEISTTVRTVSVEISTTVRTVSVRNIYTVRTVSVRNIKNSKNGFSKKYKKQ
jgi:hypothetical protein